MALVFKIKFQDTLRRWLVSEDFNSKTFSLTFRELEDKIRELFHLSPTTPLLLTYVDKDKDLVTLGDDQDLVDACLVQQLNPLRLDVRVQEPTTVSSIGFAKGGNTEAVPKTCLPYMATVENQTPVGTSTTPGLSLKHRTGLPKDLLPGAVANDGLRNILSHQPDLSNCKTGDVCYVFHCGVQCDGCGMNPIEGSRYKSKKVPNYDLCSSCFDWTGTDTDFHKLDHPETSPPHGHGRFSFFRRGVDFHSFSLKTKPTPAAAFRPLYAPECPFSGQALDSLSLNVNHGKLDARFVEDVTVLDGTELEPGTRFTKTWRMRNSGTLPWPKGTQLAHIGGTVLSTIEAVDLELPEGGLPSGQDLEISINLAAPDSVGHYVSHWHLVLPSGRWFGHTVWVAIEVVSHPEKVNGERHCKGPEQKMFSNYGMLNCGVNDSVVLSKEEEEPLSVSGAEADIELDGFSFLEKPFEGDKGASVETTSTEICFDSQMSLLETMGFKDPELYTFWLKKNNGNMDSTIQDLLRCAGWEDKIWHLEEMGFNDQRTNVSLLNKHKGSIKLVVKDLVQLENQAKENKLPNSTVL